MPSTDETWMRQALSLAADTLGLASPNPQVGCVLVRENKLVGQGAHRYDQRDHAEIVALNQAGEAARGATAYVTLEPCSHQGRTGPCADALISSGISRCVVATLDPNPLVSGQGVARLRAAGIPVEVGICQTEARTLNNAFAESIIYQRPFVTLKAALSVDGKLAPPAHARPPNQPFWLTGPQSRAEVHRLRHAHDAILTGIGTVLADDPLLTDRSGQPRRRPLLRVILDSQLRTPPSSKLVQTAQQDLWIFCAPEAPGERRQTLESLGVKVTEVAPSLDPQTVLNRLHEAKITSLLLEAGPTINGAFLRADLVDQAVLFYAETELGPDALPFACDADTPFALEARMLSVTRRTFGPDVCVSGLLHDPWASLAALEVK